MGTTLTDAEFGAHLREFSTTAFRLELQPAYSEPEEYDTVAKFLSGNPEPPTAVPGLRTWFGQVKELTEAGRRIQRVRVHDEPPTDYQRWERWIDTWNTEAGEDIRYLTRRQAHDIGLLPAAGTTDWWLLDDDRLIVMEFDAAGRRIHNELVTDPAAVKQACEWRDLAVQHAPARGETTHEPDRGPA